MSSQTLPITPVAFASALKDLPISTLHLKAAELRNSIAHLDYSNEQLRPFAAGIEPGQEGPDPDCVEAIRENEVVVKRMVERLKLLREEIEGRGGVWGEVEREAQSEVGNVGDAAEGEAQVNGIEVQEGRSEAWRDGTFQTGRIVNGEVRMNSAAAPTTNGVTLNANTNGTAGGRLDDDALRRAVEERIRALSEEGNGDGGMHL